MEVEVFAEIVCPFTHVGLRRLFAAREARGLDTGAMPIRVRAWPLELVNGMPQDPRMVAGEIAALRAEIAPDLFGGFDPARVPRTSLLAFGLADAAYAHDPATGEAVSRALRDALFEEGRDTGDPGVVAEVAGRFGLAVPDVDRAEEVARSDWERGRTRVVRGSPHFFAADRDWFCPMLDIHHEADGFAVSTRHAILDDFHAALFG